MSTGADAKTMPSTPEYEEGYERVFGKKEPERGRWIQHPITGKLIPASEYNAPETEQAINAPIMVDRFYENTFAQDGTDIGSRRKHRTYMRDKGLTTADDFKGSWEQAAKERQKIVAGENDKKERREAIGKIAYEVEKRNRNARR